MQQTLELGALTCCGSAPLFLRSPSGGGDINKCGSERDARREEAGIDFFRMRRKADDHHVQQQDRSKIYFHRPLREFPEPKQTTSSPFTVECVALDCIMCLEDVLMP